MTNILVLKEKAGDRYVACARGVDEACKGVIKERLDAGLYDGPAKDKAVLITEGLSIKQGMAWSFLRSRMWRPHETIIVAVLETLEA